MQTNIKGSCLHDRTEEEDPDLSEKSQLVEKIVVSLPLSAVGPGCGSIEI